MIAAYVPPHVPPLPLPLLSLRLLLLLLLLLTSTPRVTKVWRDQDTVCDCSVPPDLRPRLTIWRKSAKKKRRLTGWP